MTTSSTLTPAAFAQRWRGVATTEKASAQSHFIDVCRLVGEPTPLEADPTGTQYAFEKRVEKPGGGDGFADVWKRDFFACTRDPRKDLKAAYVQFTVFAAVCAALSPEDRNQGDQPLRRRGPLSRLGTVR